MLSKIQAPYTWGALPLALARRGSLPLWEAGRAAAGLVDAAPRSPEAVLLGPAGEAETTAAAGEPLYAAPEERLRPAAGREEPAAVYRLCALLYHLLAGQPPDSGAGPRDRRAALRALAEGHGTGPDSAEALFRLLDRGLRLEPLRRLPDRRALREALAEAEAAACREARTRWRMVGLGGQYAGQVLSLRALPLTAGRRPGVCGLLFAPDTAGVSRLHCRLDLAWGAVLVTDLNASFGTFLGEERLEPHLPVWWRPGEELRLGSPRQAFRLAEEQP